MLLVTGEAFDLVAGILNHLTQRDLAIAADEAADGDARVLRHGLFRKGGDEGLNEPLKGGVVGGGFLGENPGSAHGQDGYKEDGPSHSSPHGVPICISRYCYSRQPDNARTYFLPMRVLSDEGGEATSCPRSLPVSAGGVAARQQQRKRRVEPPLSYPNEVCSLEEGPHVFRLTVPHLPLDAGDNEVVNNASHPVIGPAIDHKQAPARLEDAGHLAKGTLLVWKMVERIRAGHGVEGDRAERQVFAVASGEMDAVGLTVQFVMGAVEHRDAQVQTDHVPALPR